MMTGYVRAVLEHSNTKGNERLLLLTIAAHADGDGIAYPGNECLAREANISVRQVQRLIPVIVESGELDIIQPGNGRGQKRYLRITLSALKGDTVTSPFRAHDDEERVTNPPTKDDVIMSSFSPTKGDISDVKGDISSTKGDIAMSPELKELNNKLQQQKLAANAALASNDADHPPAKSKAKVKAKAPKANSPQYTILKTAFVEIYGSDKFNHAQVGAGIKQLEGISCTSDELKGCYEWIKSDTWWEFKPVFPQTIFKQLPEYRRYLERKINTNGAQANGKPQTSSSSKHAHYDLLAASA